MPKLILKELFYVLSFAIIIFVVMEFFRPGIVLAYLDFNLILLFWVMSGIILILNSKNKKI